MLLYKNAKSHISKAFARVWHAGLLYKLEAAGVTREVLNWFKSYLSDRRQQVIVPGVSSVWNFIRTGMPQGSIPGPLLFLLFINNIVNGIDSNIRSFADDTNLFIIVDNTPYAAACLNFDLVKITRWVATWLVTFNPSKTEALLLSRKLNTLQHPPLYMENVQIQEVKSTNTWVYTCQAIAAGINTKAI